MTQACNCMLKIVTIHPFCNSWRYFTTIFIFSQSRHVSLQEEPLVLYKDWPECDHPRSWFIIFHFVPNKETDLVKCMFFHTYLIISIIVVIAIISIIASKDSDCIPRCYERISLQSSTNETIMCTDWNAANAKENTAVLRGCDAPRLRKKTKHPQSVKLIKISDSPCTPNGTKTILLLIPIQNRPMMMV